MFEPSLHWVDGIAPHRLALSPRPRGGEWLVDEVARWHAAGVRCIVSLLEPHEVRELDLASEKALCVERGIAFRSFPIPDRGTPSSRRELSAFVDELHADMLQGTALAIHCRAGIGRTGLVAGCLLHRLGVPFDDIFHRLSRARGIAMPDTAEQADWVERFAGRRPGDQMPA
ncbi:protein-tyrosine phosphatase family protein [Piscinibacter terrae]|uniref:Tyrosine protein phosphatase n=1 Tax=Piscinibacter terrae TaxID=2496871 RepID=A0A3N7J1D6_9BURK|nr:tyrosine-protein phosphatase [Albitalea terrae]RQP24762.1 tyrosine protein phosphatase [Albitalea terrae]